LSHALTGLKSPLEVVSVETLNAVLGEGNFAENIPSIDQFANHPLLQNSLVTPAPFFTYIYDRRAQVIPFVSKSVTEVTGIQHEEVTAGGFDALLNRFIPEDKQEFLTMSLRAIAHLREGSNYVPATLKTNFIYRMHHNTGRVMHMFHQSVPLYIDENRNIIYALQIVSEMPFAFQMKLPRGVMSYEDALGRMHHVNLHEKHDGPVKKITKREQQILRMLTRGLNSQTIAEDVSLSIHTVNKHRQNLLNKTGCRNTAELIEYAFRVGWL